MKLALAVIPIAGIAVAFWRLDAASAAMVTFAILAVAFFGTLPWVIMAQMDRRKRRDRNAGARIVRGFDKD